MPVEFLADAEAHAYGRFSGPPSRPELERAFFLDDLDKELVARRRGDHNRLGFALQLTTVRWLGTFLPDPLDVPGEVVAYLAGQLDIDDPGCLDRYTERRATRFEHVEEIKAAYELRDFPEVEKELEAWVDARAWTSGDGPKAIFNDALGWLAKRHVLLPGVTTLTRMVARVRDQATERLYETLYHLTDDAQRRLLESAVEVPKGARSDLERWRKAPAKATGRSLQRALERVGEIKALGLSSLDLDEAVPHRRVVELARYGMAAYAPQLRRHPVTRRVATLACTVTYLEAKAADDALELLDLLMTNDLLAKAEKETRSERTRQFTKLARASGLLARAWGAFFAATESGEEMGLDQVWAAIAEVASRVELAVAEATVREIVPPPDDDDEGAARAELSRRIGTVMGFVKALTEVIDFDANAEAAPVLQAMKALPELLRARRRLKAGDIDPSVVVGSWRPLVFGHPPHPGGIIDKDPYVLCVLAQFHRHLKRGDIYAEASSRWRDPRAHLLAGESWANARDTVLAALSLPTEPGELLASHAETLDRAYRDFAAGLGANSSAVVDEEGRLHVERLVAVPDPPSLIELRKQLSAMLPRVDLTEVVLELMSWLPGFVAAFTAASGSRARLADLHVTVAACLVAQALNIGYEPIVARGVPALERDRISHVNQNYLGAETYALANKFLVDGQAGIGLAQAWGGGMVAAVDGMRFVVPVPSVYSRPNRKYFGSKRGVTWLNMINDQAAGLGAKVVSGTARDSLHMIDLIFTQDAGRRPEVIVTDTGSYSDVVFGLVHLLGMEYRPALADLPDQRLWRVDATADYGPLNTAARGRIDVGLIRRHWPDILRAVASIYTGTVSAYDIVRMLQHGGSPTPLGEAIASYGRMFKSLHVLAFADSDETYRRDIKGIRNLQEGRHSLAEATFHARKGELRQHYYKGMEDQLGALGLVLNCVVLWNTRYQDAALAQLRSAGYPVRDEDVAHLSPFLRQHINMHGKYSFSLPDLAGGLRALRDPDSPDDEED